jgi:Ca2+-binding EF-hand superfamily protein
MFSVIDKNNNGWLLEEEFVSLLTSLSPEISVDIARASFEQFDSMLKKK